MDGAFSALAAHFRFQGLSNIDVKFVPHTTFVALSLEGNPLFTKEAECYLLDYMGPEGFIPNLASMVKKVTLIDHHKTAFESIDLLKKENKLPSNVEIVLAMEKSGSTLSYDFFNNERTLIEDPSKRKTMEEIYALVEDNDLFRRVLPNTKEFVLGIDLKKLDFDVNKNENLFQQLQSIVPKQAIEEGIIESKVMEKIISEELQKTFKVALGGLNEEKKAMFGECLGVITSYPKYRSDMGHEMATISETQGLRGIAIIFYEEAELGESKWRVSLRSVKKEDTTIISKHFGGGGHLNASAFTISREEAKKWFLK